MLRRRDLSDRASSRVRTLSGGQRRRLALAQAFIGDPPLLILDEPTTGSTPSSAPGCGASCRSRGRPGARCCWPPTRSRRTSRALRARGGARRTGGCSASTGPSPTSSRPPPARCGSPTRRCRAHGCPGARARAGCRSIGGTPGPGDGGDRALGGGRVPADARAPAARRPREEAVERPSPPRAGRARGRAAARRSAGRDPALTLGVLEARRYATHPRLHRGMRGHGRASEARGAARRGHLVAVPAPSSRPRRPALAGIVVHVAPGAPVGRGEQRAGAVPVGETVRTGALALAAPGALRRRLAWWIWAMAAYEVHAPTVDGFPFGPADDARWVRLGAVRARDRSRASAGRSSACWSHAGPRGGRRRRPAVVGVIAASIVMQGLFEPG